MCVMRSMADPIGRPV